MKLKVVKDFFDKKENKYVYPSKTPTIEREEARAQELMAAGVAEEYVEGTEPETAPVITTADCVIETAPVITTADCVIETAENVISPADSVDETEESVDEQSEQEAPAEEKPAKKGKK